MKIKKISVVWLVPLLTLSLILTLAYKSYDKQGVLIKITLPSASGIVINKTKLKYKDVMIGSVENLVISEDLQSVVASIRVDASMSKYMTNKSKFWLVKTKISLTEVSGLETILGGIYIDSFLDKTGEKSSEFVALKQSPLKITQERGLSLSLISEEVVNLEVGAPIYLANKIVGVVEKIKLIDHFKKTQLDIFIKNKFVKHINNSTLFWKMNTLKASLKSNNEFQIELAPIKSLLVGGIRLKTMKDKAVKPLKNKFTLYGSKQNALHSYKRKEFSQILRFVLFFKDVHGLEVGADVEYLGVKVGKVISIQLYRYPDNEMKAPVVIEVFPETINATNKNYPHKTEIINAIENHGLRAMLKTANFLTGSLYIVLGRESKKLKAIKVEIDPVYNYPVFATQENALFNNINKSLVDIKKTSKSMRKFLDSVYEDPSQIIWGK